MEIIKVYTKYDHIPAGLIYPVLMPSAFPCKENTLKFDEAGNWIGIDEKLRWGQEVFKLVEKEEGQEGGIFTHYRKEEGSNGH